MSYGGYPPQGGYYPPPQNVGGYGPPPNQGYGGYNAPIRLENGLITALREGTALIYVRAADGYGADAYCNCTVTILPATSTGDIEGFDDDDNFEWDTNQ